MILNLDLVLTTNNGKVNVELEFFVTVKANAEGDITAKFSGRSGLDGEVVLGKALPPITVESDAKDVRIGVKEQPISDIIIKETKEGALLEGDLEITLPENIKWNEVPKIEVVGEDSRKLVELDIDGADLELNDRRLVIPVKNSSSVASEIHISGASIDL